MAAGVRSRAGAGPNRRGFLAGVCATALAGCKGSGRKTIAVIPKATSNVFWVSVQKGADDAGKEFGVNILWNGPSTETEYSRQVQILDSMVAQRVDGIAIAPSERQVLVAPIERAAAANIPLTVFDSGADTTNYVSYVGTDNVEAGRAAARTLGEMLGGKGKAGIVMHAPGSASTMDREKGFDEVMKREFPGIQIAATQFSMGDRAKGRAAAENILTAHPDLNGLFASSEPSSIGAALAVRARNLSDKVVLVAFDSSESMVEDLKAGIIDAMVVQDPYRMGYEAVRSLTDKLAGRVPGKRLDLNAVVIRAKDLGEQQAKRLLNLR